MFEIKKYTQEDKAVWDAFVKESKNATFLFHRDYMDYHADRFVDSSLLLYKNNTLYALFPANVNGNVVYSHQGLTYGGLLLSTKATLKEVLGIFDQISIFYKSDGIEQIIYKAIPYIYHKYSAQEDLYALFRNNAQLICRHASSTIDFVEPIKFPEQRRAGIRKAIRNDLAISLSEDFTPFWSILTENLVNRYGKKPVHNLEEISLLKEKFPQNIKLYLVYHGEEAIAGTVVYEFNHLVHVQYISANSEGKNLGALDILFDNLINETYKTFSYFDFGQSTEDNGMVLNEGLIFQKEGFGGRCVTYDTYKIEL